MAHSNYPHTTWYAPELEIRPSSIQGNGMFATRPIHAGEHKTGGRPQGYAPTIDSASPQAEL